MRENRPECRGNQETANAESTVKCRMGRMLTSAFNGVTVSSSIT